jgi:hypothetical protein
VTFGGIAVQAHGLQASSFGSWAILMAYPTESFIIDSLFGKKIGQTIVK